MAKRETEGVKVGEFGSDFGEVLEDLEESYAKIGQLEKELAASKNQS